MVKRNYPYTRRESIYGRPARGLVTILTELPTTLTDGAEEVSSQGQRSQ